MNTTVHVLLLFFLLFEQVLGQTVNVATVFSSVSAPVASGWYCTYVAGAGGFTYTRNEADGRTSCYSNDGGNCQWGFTSGGAASCPGQSGGLVPFVTDAGLSSDPYNGWYWPQTAYENIMNGASLAYPEGPNTVISIYWPKGIATDVNGTVYVADTVNNRIRKIVPSTGVVSTLAGNGAAAFADGFGTFASFMYPRSVEVDVSGNVYVGDQRNHRIRKISQVGQVATLAGSGTAGFAEGQGNLASFSQPCGIALDPAGNVFVADWGNNRIRKVTAGGLVSTFAGTGAASSGDGAISSATFLGPTHLTLDSLGNLYVVGGSDLRKVMRVINSQSSTVSTLSLIDGPGTAAVIGGINGMTADPLNNIYITDTSNQRIRKILPTGIVSTLAGSGTAGSTDGQGTLASFSGPKDITYDYISQSFYVVDQSSAKVRKIIVCPSGTLYDSVNKTCLCPATATYDALNGACICKAGISFLSNDTCICPIGQIYNGARTQCVACADGKYRASLSAGNCSDCPIGSQSSLDKTSCTICSAGKYRPSLSNPTCIDCPLFATCGTTSVTSSQSICPLFATCNSTAITSCQAGYKTNAAANSCEQCPVGSQSSPDSLSCVACVTGSTYRTASMSSCQFCPLNSVCSASGFNCNAGYEMNVTGVCSLCQDGYSKPSSGNSSCIPCTIGTESASNKQSCTSCPSGYYRASLGINKCVICPTGATCTATALTRCPNGYKRNTAGDGCDQCPIGQDSFDGLTCQVCSTGYFKPDQSYSMCVRCPDGSSSCAGSTVSCQTGYFYDSNVQCKRNETFFSLVQPSSTNPVMPAVTSYLTVPQTRSVYATATVSTTIFATQIISSSNGLVNGQTVIVSQSVFVTPNAQTAVTPNAITVSVTPNAQTVTVTSTTGSDPAGKQVQSANSVTIDFLGTLPFSPLIFGLACMGMGVFLMLIVALICCRRSPHRRKDADEFDGAAGMTTNMNTQSQRTFTNTTSSMR